MILPIFVIACAFTFYVVDAVDYPVAGPTFDASKFTKWDKLGVQGSRKGTIYVPFQADD